MGVLPDKVLELLKEEYKLQIGVQKQVEDLSEELKSINRSLDVVSRVPPDKLDPETKHWGCDVKEASYDMEDILDDFLVRVDRGPQQPDGLSQLRRLMSKIMELFCFRSVMARHEIATEIVGIMERLEGIHARHAKYRLDDRLVAAAAEPAAASSIVDPRISALVKDASHLVGIQEPRDALIEMLSLGEEHIKLKIVSIFGSGGLGKTTLAKAVYDKVNRNFDCWAFVSVGQNPDPTKLLQDILVGLADNEREETVIRHDKETTVIDRDKKRYITRADLNGLTANDLVIEISKFLQGKRCFIVVDDIWDEKIWFEAIENAFVNSNTGTRIIATTRRSDVAKKIGELFEIQQLSGDSPKKLLSKILFDSEDKIDNDEMAEKFLDKCHGLPLGITAIGRVLARKPKSEWSDVYDTIFSNSFGLESGKDLQIKNAMMILSFSYYDLPCHLRTCMLYLSVFPEEHYVDKNMLIWRWVAEGFVLPEQRKGPFEVGEGYFDELVNRGLILPLSADLVDAYSVHDFVLELIRGLSREQNFVITVAGSEQEQSLSPTGGGKVRRLALQKISDRVIKCCLPVEVDDEQMAVVRSFNAIFSSMLDHISVAGFKRLRVLALECCMVKEGYLEDIGKLLHLRYLGLTCTQVGKLPEGVGNLKFLQTLMLYGTGIKELPKSLEHRTQLMCLRADETTAVPDWIGKQTSLVELEMYPGASGAARFVKDLSELRRLRVVKTKIYLEDQGQVRELLESLNELREIEIMEVREMEMIMEVPEGVPDFTKKNNLRVLILDAFKFPRLPAWINSEVLPKLSRLKLCMSRFEQQDMEILGRFPNLRILDLIMVGGAILKKIVVGEAIIWEEDDDVITCGEGGFQNLVAFQFIPFGRILGKLLLDYGLGNLGSLQQAQALIICWDCFPAEVEAVEAAIRHQVLDIRPNNPPTLYMTRYQVDTTGITDAERMERLLQTHRCAGLWQRHKNQSLPFTQLIWEMNEMVMDWSRRYPLYQHYGEGRSNLGGMHGQT
ncbi:unnamed protein product [Urochloa decumbens]|uniref:Uncharacterized protein n=1 Tax=Urochloa decumbens TaxID=240449 RepID=A0ABC9BPK0_9POAL